MDENVEKEEAIRLAIAGFPDVLVQMVLSFTAPLYWYDSSATIGHRLINNGTIFFVRMPERLIGITANHVYQSFLSASRVNKAVRASFFENDFPLQERLLSYNKDLDIATFEILDSELEVTGDKSAYTPPSDWPPLPPQEYRAVHFCGFPGELREENGLDLNWTPYSAQTIAQVVREDRILIQFEREYWIDPLNRGLPPENLWLGGMSGCPLFALWEKPVTHVRLAGIGIEFNKALEIARFCPMHFITSDGIIEP